MSPIDLDDEKRAFDWMQAHQCMAATDDAPAEEWATAPEVLERIWARRAVQLARPLVQEDEGDRIELVLARLGYEVYGFEARYVSNVRPVSQLTRVPRTPDWVAGVVNLRGHIFSAIDLRRFLGLPSVELSQETEPATPYLVIVDAPKLDLAAALLVDGVLAIESFPTSQVQGISETLHALNSEYARGVILLEGNEQNPLLVVLDLPILLADERLIVEEKLV